MAVFLLVITSVDVVLYEHDIAHAYSVRPYVR